MSRMQEIALIIGAVAALITAVLGGLSGYILPFINRRLARDAAQPKVVEQGQQVMAGDAVEAWKGRALAAEARASKYEARAEKAEARLDEHGL